MVRCGEATMDEAIHKRFGDTEKEIVNDLVNAGYSRDAARARVRDIRLTADPIKGAK